MKKIITVLAIALVIISCEKSEEEIHNKSGEIKTLPYLQNGRDIILNGSIISFGIPTATECGFLWATSAALGKRRLRFNDGSRTVGKGITIVYNLFPPTDKIVKQHLKELNTVMHKYRAYIRNYEKVSYGDIVPFTVNGPHNKEPKINAPIITGDSIIFEGIVLDTIMSDSIKEVGFVISRIPFFILSEATKYRGVRDTLITQDTINFKRIFKVRTTDDDTTDDDTTDDDTADDDTADDDTTDDDTTDDDTADDDTTDDDTADDDTADDNTADDNFIVNNIKYYVRAYATYNTDSTFYSYNDEGIVVGKLPSEISKGKIETIETLDKTEDESNTILNGRIISFGKPASTEHGFLLTNEEFTKSSLVFNANNITADKKIRIIPITADIAGNIEYSSNLGGGNYWYRAWIRNSSGVEYGEMEKFTK